MAANILVVEDEPAIQELLVFNLQQAGHHAISAASAEQAYTVLRDALPDLILLDWMLPGMSGIEFARRLKAESYTKAHADHHADGARRGAGQDRGLETGADDYITKPFSSARIDGAHQGGVAPPRAADDRRSGGNRGLAPRSRHASGHAAAASRSNSDRRNSACCISS